MAQKVNSSVWLGVAPHPCIAPYRRPRQRMAFGVLCRWPPTKNPAFSEHR